MDRSLRLAYDGDIPELEALIGRSVRELQAAYYSAAQMDGALGSVFGVDRQLIRDETYFVAEQDGAIIACTADGANASRFSEAMRAFEYALLDPLQDAARIRAFFVHPEYARRSLGRALLFACEDAIRAARFRSIELVATLPGVPFYRAFDYEAGERYELPLVNGLRLPLVRMSKNLVSPNQ
ncbi:MAG TPA: GNAT family N-acetyltransferase [Chthoniobacterales bacterium]